MASGPGSAFHAEVWLEMNRIVTIERKRLDPNLAYGIIVSESPALTLFHQEIDFQFDIGPILAAEPRNVLAQSDHHRQPIWTVESEHQGRNETCAVRPSRKNRQARCHRSKIERSRRSSHGGNDEKCQRQPSTSREWASLNLSHHVPLRVQIDNTRGPFSGLRQWLPADFAGIEKSQAQSRAASGRPSSNNRHLRFEPDLVEHDFVRGRSR